MTYSSGAGQQSECEIRRENLLSAVANSLIQSLNAELSQRYPEDGANHFRLDPEEVTEGRGAFYVAYRDGQPVGCGAVRLLDPDTAEIKRMYVAPEARGLGIGRSLLDSLESDAGRLGARRLVLETGERQGEALALYARAGFSRIPAFGEYVGSPLSVCMAKTLQNR
jgi:GNAT superfamily N-acetyltransferase